MNSGIICGCAHTNTTPAKQSVSHSLQFASVSFRRIQASFMARTINAEPLPSMGDMSLSSVLKEMPDIRLFFKPWYFNDADKHNMEVAHQFARDVLNHPRVDRKISFEMIFQTLRYEHKLSVGRGSVSGMSSSNPGSLLSDSDRSMLEKMHEFFKAQGVDAGAVDKIARQFVLDRMGKGGKPCSLEDKDYVCGLAADNAPEVNVDELQAHMSCPMSASRQGYSV